MRVRRFRRRARGLLPGRAPAACAALALALALATAALPPRAGAHIVVGTATLWQLLVDAPLVARLRIEDPAARHVTASGVQRPVVRARVLEVLKAPAGGAERPAPGAPLRFAQHGHGAAEFAAGEEALVFLRPLARTGELAALAGDPELRWVSLQEHGEKWSLDAATRGPVLDALRAYLEVLAVPEPEGRFAALRAATLLLLASPDPRVGRSALRDLVLLADAPAVRQQDLPALEALLARGDVDVGVRLGLLAELERRRLVEGDPRWVALLRGTAGHERVAVVRAVAAHPGPGVTAVLLEILGGDDLAAAEAAAVSLGSAGEAGVPGLAAALQRAEPRLRMAAIRGLGRAATPAARAALEGAAEAHPDAATRRRAAAEVRRLAAAGIPISPSRE